MDELAFHAYPELDSQPFGVASSWPKVGLVDLARLKQAVWDAFNGTAQPTFAETGQSQMLPALRAPHRGGGLAGRHRPLRSGRLQRDGERGNDGRDQPGRGLHPGDPVARMRPGRRVAGLLRARGRDRSPAWQAGLIRADGTTRPSYDAVKSELATSHGNCAGAPVTWKHTTGVVGVAARFDARKTLPARFVAWSFPLGVKENALFTAGLFRVPGTTVSARSRTLIGRALAVKAPSTMKPVVKLSGRALAPFGRTVTFARKRVKAGVYVYGIRLAAEMNPNRVTFMTGKPFRVGAAAKAKKKRRRTR